MAFAQIGYTNVIPKATLLLANSAPQSLTTGLTPANLQNDQGSASMAWQSPLASSGTVDCGLTVLPVAPIAMTVLSLHRTNLTSAATVQITRRATATTNVNAPFLDQKTYPLNVAFGQSVIVMPNVGLVGSFDFIISDHANPDGFISIALCYAGAVWAPMRNLSFNSTNGRMVGIDDTQTRGGQEFPNYRYMQRTYKADFQNVKDAEVWTQLDPLDRTSRSGGNVLLIPDPASATINNEAIFGRLTAISDLARTQAAYGNRQWSTVVTERL